ncbi:hypothetical protein EVAR_86954_1 [Eumeta japonica]|uniref:Uncharacterized protein n=1 Tax=Eumeta variegata TaxID=151549 RepID=A0A4C1W6L4_EUMVA|nr:hypothetical protein EVAR_86954_1 [Eumeta japonica]
MNIRNPGAITSVLEKVPLSDSGAHFRQPKPTLLPSDKALFGSLGPIDRRLREKVERFDHPRPRPRPPATTDTAVRPFLAVERRLDPVSIVRRQSL